MIRGRENVYLFIIVGVFRCQNRVYKVSKINYYYFDVFVCVRLLVVDLYFHSVGSNYFQFGNNLDVDMTFQHIVPQLFGETFLIVLTTGPDQAIRNCGMFDVSYNL